MRFRTLLVAGILLSAVSAFAPAQDARARAAADSMQRKLLAIVTRGESPSARQPLLRTSFTDGEVNAYFRLHGPDFLPEGVVDPQLAIDREGRVRARAVVDLDQALKPQDRGWLDPLAWVGGKVELTGEGTLRAANGRGVFLLESATLGGVSIPPTVLQEVVSYYTRTPELPRGFQLSEPFALPSAIKSVETAPGRATVVQ
jgi:hypothetical protein